LFRWVITFVAVAAALAAPSSLAQGVVGPSVFRSHSVPAGATASFMVTCPSGLIATSAGIANPAPAVTLLSIRPSGIGAYAFRFGNPGTDDQTVIVVVACRKISSSKSLALRQKVVQVKVTLPPATVRSAAFPCPARTAPAGRGFEVSPGGGAGLISVRKTLMHLHGFLFSVRNSGRQARTIVLYGNCLTLIRAVGAGAAQLGFRIDTFNDLTQPGTRSITHRCPTGWVSLATGYALKSPLQTVHGAAAIGAGGQWWVANAAQAPAVVQLQLVCGALQR
jgi:hypothetical protein